LSPNLTYPTNGNNREPVVNYILKYGLIRHRSLVAKIEAEMNRIETGSIPERAKRTTWDIISFLCHSHYLDEAPSLADVYLATGLSKGTAINCIRRLENLGVVDKLTDHQDRRRVSIVFTKIFKAILDDFIEECCKNFNHLFQDKADLVKDFHLSENKPPPLFPQKHLNATKATDPFELRLATISHELRTPLNAVIGFSEIIKEEILGPITPKGYLGCAEDIHLAAQHLLALLNDIIDLSSSADKDFLAINEEHFDIDDAISECHKIIEPQLTNHQTTLDVEIARDIPHLYCDQNRFKQVILNLLDNAIKYSPPGNIIHVKASIAGNGHLLISIKDNGFGIDPEQLETALTPRGRTDQAIQSESMGAGLGLPLAKSLIERHGGLFEIASEIGEGTIIQITLPKSRLLGASLA